MSAPRNVERSRRIETDDRSAACTDTSNGPPTDSGLAALSDLAQHGEAQPGFASRTARLAPQIAGGRGQPPQVAFFSVVLEVNPRALM